MNAVEIDETDWLVRTVAVGDARPQRPGHERQVRVGVPRLLGLLRLGQLGPPVDLVVLVPRPFREHRPEDVDVRT